jgi:membrane protease YdiL (CAAX protease family)
MKLTQRNTKQASFEGLFLLLPTYLVCGSAILSALLLFIKNTFHIQFNSTTLDVYYNAIFDITLLIFAAIIFRKELKKQMQDLTKIDVFKIVNYVIISIPVLYLAEFVGSLLTLALTGEASTSENQSSIELLIKQLPVLMIFIVVVIAPMLEEIIFRLFLFTSVYPKGRILAYLVSGGLFGLLHVLTHILQGNFSELFLVFPYLFMGMGLCFIYEYSDNIYVAMIAHGIMNLISVLLMIL